ncbi:recombinase family protein [Comamonas thiooxydans]|uniref:recombinase family protein n=1 Tax=Comamonas thiooxydans TaxID=363952 RepID=UPI001CCCC1F2|nr:recombinase family protein [Comamonas thiooxydans]UBQ44638.1 recombinase family protein [Comamonas thiooxydans]
MAKSESIRLVGYARVSTREQETFLQIDALKKAGVSEIYEEKASSVGRRPELRRCLDSLRKGDTLVVYRMDRVARSLKDLLEILERIHSVGASIKSLTEPLDTSGPIGVFMVQVLGSVAQLERSIIRERALAGQVSAYQRGKRWGGSKPKLGAAQISEMKKLKAEGYTLKQLMAKYELSMSSVCRYLGDYSTKREGPRLPVLGALVAAA